MTANSILVNLCNVTNATCHTKLIHVYAALFMKTSSNGNIFRFTGTLYGEFPTQTPETQSFDVVLDYDVTVM